MDTRPNRARLEAHPDPLTARESHILMAPDDENVLLRRRMEESSLHQLSRLIPCADRSQAGGSLPIKMLKMKEPPGMCMKTKGWVTKWPRIDRALRPKCTDCAVIRGETGGARTSSRPFAPAAIDMTATRCAPSPGDPPESLSWLRAPLHRVKPGFHTDK